MTRKARSSELRDQAPSGFNSALERLCESTCALSAALVDSIGETVDYAGTVAPYETRVAAAEWALILKSIRSISSFTWKSATELSFRGKRRTFVVVALGQGYALVLELRARRLSASARALSEAVRSISDEAGLELPATWSTPEKVWMRVEVEADRGLRRPLAIMRGGRWCGVEVLGRLARNQLLPSESGYRVRTNDGAELTLIREPLNTWYTDDPAALTEPGR